MKIFFLYLLTCFSIRLNASCFGERINIVEELHNKLSRVTVFLAKIDSTSQFPHFTSMASVLGVYKGDVEEKVVINSGDVSSSGGDYLLPGETYLVFGIKFNNEYRAFVCDHHSTRIYDVTGLGKYYKMMQEHLDVVKKWKDLADSKYSGPMSYYLDGNLIAKGQYRKGKPHGKWEYYEMNYENQFKLFATQQYKNGILHGYQNKLDKAFTYMEREQKFKKGELVEEKHLKQYANKQALFLSSKTEYFTKQKKKWMTYTSYDTLHNLVNVSTNVYTGIDCRRTNLNLQMVRHGYGRYRDELRKEIREGEYFMGKKIGIWKSYTLSDSLILQEEFEPYMAETDSTVLYLYDSEMIKGRIINGAMQGTWSQYKNNGDTILFPFRNNEIWGDLITLSKESIYHVTYLNDKKNGISFETNRNTKDTIYKAYFLEDALNGEEILYYKNGQVRSKTNYKNGLLDGLQMQYDTLGNLVKSCGYIKGVYSGHYLENDIKHDRFLEGNYFYGLKYGKWLSKYTNREITERKYMVIRDKKSKMYSSITVDELEYVDPNYEIIKN